MTVIENLKFRLWIILFHFIFFLNQKSQKCNQNVLWLAQRDVKSPKKIYSCFQNFCQKIISFAKDRFDINAHRLNESNLSALWRLISKKKLSEVSTLDNLNWLCKGKVVISWWKFENELWSFISFNGVTFRKWPKKFLFWDFGTKNSIFHDKFNHIFHFSVRWLFHKILKLLYSF